MSILTEWYEKLIDFAKQNPTIIFWFFICSAILTITPDNYLRIIYLEGLKNNIAPITGLIFLLSGVLLFIKMLSSGKESFQKRREKLRELNQ